jgi:hypothetical protein
MVRWIALIVVASLPMKSADAPAAEPTNQGARPVADRKVPPPLPPSPVEFFRQLLKMNAQEREAELAKRPKTREVLEAKLKEFGALGPVEQENRLRMLELQSYLRPLMKAPATNRAEQLKAIPARDRDLVEARLKLWDKLPADQQRDLLESELAILIFYRPTNATVTFSRFSVTTTGQQERIRRSMEYLNNLPQQKRDQLYKNFGEFFELSEHEKVRALGNVRSLSEGERKQMERTLQAFEKLPPQERDRCIEGFEKFRALSAAEQAHFLKSAERWDAMTAKDRQVWRSLVNRKAFPLPPSPPGLTPGVTNPAAIPKPAEFEVATNR